MEIQEMIEKFIEVLTPMIFGIISLESTLL